MSSSEAARRAADVRAGDPIVAGLAPYDLTQVVLLARRAAMSTSYKPALLKALARIVRRQPARQIPLTAIGSEFVRMYWNQTVVFHLRQAAVLTKEPEVIKAIRQASFDNATRKLDVLPENARARLETEMARILTLDVLRRFHASAPASMPPLFAWSKGDRSITLSDQAFSFVAANSWVLESLANLWWARYLERVNILAPFIIEKVEREGAQRGSLARFLRILQDTDESRCFYCEREFTPILSASVDHVIPWSYLLADPPWDLVLACSACNSSKSDTLPSRFFIDKLAIVNERRAKLVLPSAFGSPLVSIDQVGKFYDAALAVEWPSGWQP
jgi:hypothetical protein